MEQVKGKWAEELPGVLWAYRPTRRTPTSETPFSLAYGTEAVISVEIGMPTLKTKAFEQESNDQQLMENLDLLEERKDQANIRMEAYQQRMVDKSKVGLKTVSFQVGNLILRRVFQNTKDPTMGKLSPNWEGPYRITKVVRPTTY